MNTEKTSSKAKKTVVKAVPKKRELYIAFGPNESYGRDDPVFDVNSASTAEEAANPDHFPDTTRSKIVVLNVSDFLYRFDGKVEDIAAQVVFDDADGGNW